LAYGLLKNLDLTVQLATPVFQHQTDPTPPTFSDYAGGTLQQAYLDQWQALTNLRNLAPQVVALNSAVQARVAQYQAVWSQLTTQAQSDCSSDAFAAANDAGYSSSSGTSTTVSSNGDSSTTTSHSSSYSDAPTIAQTQKCAQSTLAIGPAQKQVLASLMDAILSVVQGGVQVSNAVQALQTATAKIQQLSNQTQLAIARDQLQESIANQSPSLKSSFGLYMILASDDVYHAKLALQSAQLQSVLARRAIEARYVVNLGQMTANEPLVVAPSTWADEVYAYDESIPAALGLTVGSQPPTQVYPYSLSQYATNLQSFVNGYTLSRPIALVPADPELFALPPPQPVLSGAPAGSFSWSYYCPNSNGGGTWVGLASTGKLSDTCGPGQPAPLRARVSFDLDPWADVLAEAPITSPTAIFNARWVKLAVNLEGSTIRDCAVNPTPDCVAQQYVEFNLRHTGPAWISDYQGSWRSLGVSAGLIEDGKALANETILDVFSWNTQPNSSYAAAVARTELADRPLGGTYTLDLNPNSDPQIRLANITEIQLLYQRSYWVKQQ
jgi:hypothetical protein